APAASPATSIPRPRSTLATPWRNSAHSSTITARRPDGGTVEGEGGGDGAVICARYRPEPRQVEGPMGTLSGRPFRSGYAAVVPSSDGGRSGSSCRRVYQSLTDPDHARHADGSLLHRPGRPYPSAQPRRAGADAPPAGPPRGGRHDRPGAPAHPPRRAHVGRPLRVGAGGPSLRSQQGGVVRPLRPAADAGSAARRSPQPGLGQPGSTGRRPPGPLGDRRADRIARSDP